MFDVIFLDISINFDAETGAKDVSTSYTSFCRDKESDEYKTNKFYGVETFKIKKDKIDHSTHSWTFYLYL